MDEGFELPNYSEDYLPTSDELLEDEGLDRCQECNEWYRPDGRATHGDCPARIKGLRLIASL